eukprot:TRINITY_DN1050_c2_g2_i1.p1 TRINITY_DN1050_c2_g2~~TRINITY_DN1050_c2_g2_i1.p1  ORF type:complete len:132 (-),score=57.05 TRINITY_DN1050_c2_g2_i1:31-426(-)
MEMEFKTIKKEYLINNNNNNCLAKKILVNKSQRRYFDSAEFFMNGIINPPHPIVHTNNLELQNFENNNNNNKEEEIEMEIKIKKTNAKYPSVSCAAKAVRINREKRQRKYFDSAEWVLNGTTNLPHPTLSI